MRIFLYIFLALIILVMLLTAIVFMHFQLSPRIGTDPTGERLSRIEASINYRSGRFENLESTSMDIPIGVMGKVIWESLVGGVGREPSMPIQTVTFDKAAWQAIADTSFGLAWFGHSTVLLKLDGLTLLFDPVFSERASAFSFVGPKRFPYTEHASVDDLPPIDVVILSHDHYDHLDHASVEFLKDSVHHWYMPLGVGAHLEHWDVDPKKIYEKEWWESGSIGGIELTLVPSRHFSGRGLKNRFSTLWGGWVIQGSHHRILFGGDSGYSKSFAEIGSRFGPFDLVMLECGAYNEHWSEIHMMPEEVPRAAADLQAHVLMPIHWGKFDLALHPWKEPIDRLTNAMQGGPIRLFTPRIGSISTNTDPNWSIDWWSGVK